MDKIGYFRGLVGYATPSGMDEKWTSQQMLKPAMRPRVLVYSVILLLIVAAAGASVALRSPFRVDIVQDRGAMARVVDEGKVENVYRLQIMKATEAKQTYRVQVRGKQDGTLAGQGLREKLEVQVGSAEARWVALDVQLSPKSAAQAGPGTHAIDV